ncbi:MAG TPA: nucleoside phosphorylase [Ruminiclostridium sp.]|nr:nucleoside phosphorylase [Ruminiclostridium sp.]
MITDTFDITTEAILSPEKFYGTHKALCDICIITFSNQITAEILKQFACVKIAEIESTNGSIPCYKLNYKGKDIAFYMTMIGSAGAGACLEETHCLIGATKYIMFGACGCLNSDITAGKIIVPTDAYRDEGLSYHYAKASDYIKMKNAAFVAAFFKEAGIPYVTGKTWTTDAIYRETHGNMEKRKAEGCITVEMESAGVQAVCDFRNLDFYNFLIGGDLLDSPEWDRRILGDAGELIHQIKSFYMALELALRI